MTPPASALTMPNHKIRARGRKWHAIPIDDAGPHRASRLCECDPVPSGMGNDEWGHGLWIHNKTRSAK